MKALWVLLAVWGAGCTALTQFDPESQPCELNAPVGQQCLAGFECVATPDGGLCRHVDGGTP